MVRNSLKDFFVSQVRHPFTSLSCRVYILFPHSSFFFCSSYLVDTLVFPSFKEVINLNHGNEIFASAHSGSSISMLFTNAREVLYLKKTGWDDGRHDGVLENDTHYDPVVFHVLFFFSYLTSIFIHGKYHNKSSVSCRNWPISPQSPLHSLSVHCSFFPPPLSICASLPMQGALLQP